MDFKIHTLFCCVNWKLIIDFYKIYELEDSVFEDIKGEADTLGGLLLELGGAIPKKEETFEYKNFTFVVTSVDKRRIKKIKTTYTPPKKKE